MRRRFHYATAPRQLRHIMTLRHFRYYIYALLRLLLLPP